MNLRKSVSSVFEFVKWVEEVADLFTYDDMYEEAWFRGMSSERYKLMPGLYRSEVGREKYSDDELRAEFKRRALPLVAERPPRDDWEWYFLMQHYGAPTRLLDWSSSALVALYFAISSTRLSDKDAAASKPAVWALNPWKLNKASSLDGPVTPGVTDTDKDLGEYLSAVYKSGKPPQYPIAINPTFIAQRMLVQHSHFTLHGCDPRGLEDMKEELGISDHLFRVVINTDADGIKIMKWRLATLGISETTIYPDLGGLGRELSHEYDVIG